MTDPLRTFIGVHLDIGDRLRVLFGRVLHVDVTTVVEGDNRYFSSSKAWVERFVMPWAKRGGYSSTPYKDDDETA